MSVCFYTVYDSEFKLMATGLVRSIKRYYPDIPVFEYEIPRVPNSSKSYHTKDFDLKIFCDFHLQRGKELLDKFDRVISVDADEIMTAPCPELFGDFDLGVVQNNCNPFDNYSENIVERYTSDDKTGVYLNAGLTVCTNSVVWEEWIKAYQKLNDSAWNILNEQTALNNVYHGTNYKFKLLEFPDKLYGISGMKHYADMKLVDGNLYVNGKLLCIFHAAGSAWKLGGGYVFDHVRDKTVIEFLKTL